MTLAVLDFRNQCVIADFEDQHQSVANPLLVGWTDGGPQHAGSNHCSYSRPDLSNLHALG
jgi:hypothetical protein